MFWKEIKRVLIHIRFPLQAYALFCFVFALLILKIDFNYKFVLALLSWSLLCAGLTVFNSYYDKDEKSVAGLKNPPKVSKSLFYGGLFMKLFGLVLAISVNSLFTWFYILTIILSILYSHKYFRFKSNAYLALFFNFLSGFVSFFAISSLSSSFLSKLSLFGAITCGFFSSSSYLTMQIHQMKEDKERGDESYALLYGRKNTLITSFAFMLFSGIFAAISFYLSLSNIIPTIISSLYFMIILITLYLWIKIKENTKKDFNIMSRINFYSLYLGISGLVIFYLVF